MADTNGMNLTIPCPQCDGEGKKVFEQFVDDEPQGVFKTFVCGNCKGVGTVDNVQEDGD